MKIKKLTAFVLAVLAVLSVLSGCSSKSSESKEVVHNESKTTQSEEPIVSNQGYEVDYLKISALIKDNVGQDVIDAALNVIKAFLNYENSASIVISGNKARFLNDMGYVINCTCPLFSAFCDFNEMTAYKEETKTVEWKFYVSKDEFQKTVTEFNETVKGYLSKIDKNDSDAMKAILLYYAVIQNASYDYDILGDAYETMDKSEYNLRDSAYNVLVNKAGICTSLSQALMFLYTQADLKSGTVLHQGGAGSHMWSIVEIDGKYYYCDPTWDVGESPKTFGITADDRSSWAGGYTKEEGTMLSVVVDQKYEVNDERFVELRQKLPVEITDVKIDKDQQKITFVGYDYEYTFNCK